MSDCRVVGPVRKRRRGCEQHSGCGDERDAEAGLVVEVLGASAACAPALAAHIATTTPTGRGIARWAGTE